MTDGYDLERFREAHREYYGVALDEIRAGYKSSHWMWFIFPQMAGLGKSPPAVYYSIANIDEATEFAADDYLGSNLRGICRELLNCLSDDAEDIFGSVDAKKLRSSMTLFREAAEDNGIFTAVLEKFFGGAPCQRTLELLEQTDPWFG